MLRLRIACSPRLSGGAPAKGRGKAKDLTRQTTLFGLPARTPADDLKRGRTKANPADDPVTQDTTSNDDLQMAEGTLFDPPDQDTQSTADQPNSTDGDAQLVDDVMEDTQQSEAETPLDSSPPAAEATRDESIEPMEWPASPEPSSTPLTT